MKTKISLIVIGILFGCQNTKSIENPKIKKGMIKMAIFYPNGEGKTFDMDYYSKKHMPMASSLFGDALKAMSIDKGIAGRTPDMPATYVAIGYFYFEDMSTFQNSIKQHSEKLRVDVANYTNIKPLIQISEVKMAE